MSHFTAWVLIAADTMADDIESKVGEALAPFDENVHVPEYDERCYCVGQKAKLSAHQSAEQEFGTIDSIRAAYRSGREIAPLLAREHALEFSTTKLTQSERDEYNAISAKTGSAWKARIGPYIKHEQDHVAAHPLREAADPTCEECSGSGLVKSEYNPKSKWDWWVIGGRWAGAINGIGDDMPESVNMFENREGYEHARDIRNSVRANSRTVANMPSPVPDNMIPYAILTPDGTWHEKGKMGWFGMSSDESDSWKDDARSLLAQYGNCLAVAVDLHI